MSLNLVSEHLLAANGLSHQDLFSILGQLTERRLDYGDLYFQSSYHESWVLEDSIIKDGSYNIDQGVGVRAVSGEKTGFAYADQISLAALEQSAQAARTIVRDTGDGRVKTLGEVQHSALYTSIDPLQSMSREEKLDILRRVDKVARAADKRVQEVSASLSGVYELIMVAATDGTLAADVRPLVRLSISVQVEDDGKRERGSSGGGGRFGYDWFLGDVDGEARADAWAKRPCAWRWLTCLPWQPRRYATGGAGRWLAGRAAARSGWARSGRRFQPSRYVRIQRPDGAACLLRAVYRGG